MGWDLFQNTTITRALLAKLIMINSFKALFLNGRLENQSPDWLSNLPFKERALKIFIIGHSGTDRRAHLQSFCQAGGAGIGVSFCRTGKMAISCHIFSKSKAFV